MFIERLKDEEILEFLKNSLFVIAKDISERGEIKRYGDAVAVFVKLDNGAIRIISLSDFNVSTDKEISAPMLNFQWKKFMHQKSGDEYKQAFNENLKKKYEEEMIKW